MTSEETPGRRRLAIELVAFFVLVFALNWAICGAYLIAPELATSTLGPMKTGSPIYYVAVYAPSVSAIILTFAFNGLSGLRQLGASIIRIAGHWWWIVLALIGYPLFWLLTYVVQALIGGRPLTSVPYHDWYIGLPLVVLTGFVFRDPGPLGEELGWRGFALPRLLGMTGPRTAAVGLGAVWAIWHLPAFYLAGLSQSHFDFRVFFFVVVGFSVLMTILFIHTRGSVLLAGVIQHMWFNGVSKAGIHWIDWLVIVVAGLLLVLGGAIWRVPSDFPRWGATRTPATP
jgi:hypothetical protein